MEGEVRETKREAGKMKGTVGEMEEEARGERGGIWKRERRSVKKSKIHYINSHQINKDIEKLFRNSYCHNT